MGIAKGMRNLSFHLMMETLNRQIKAKNSKDVIQALLHHQTHMCAHTQPSREKGELSVPLPTMTLSKRSQGNSNYFCQGIISGNVVA